MKQCVEGKAACRSPTIARFATHGYRRTPGRPGPCHSVVIATNRMTGERSTEGRLRETIVHEYVLHCSLYWHLEKTERAELLDWVAESVPWRRIRGWHDNPGVEQWYRRRTGIKPQELLLGGHIDTSPRPNTGADREQVLWYLEEAFAALVDGTLAGQRRPHRTMTAAERYLFDFARQLDAAAQAGQHPEDLELKFQSGVEVGSASRSKS